MNAETREVENPTTVRHPRVGDREMAVTGSWIKIASVLDEAIMEEPPVDDPERFVAELKKGELKADLFTFAQPLEQTEPKYQYHMEWDNAAAVQITDYENWFRKRIATDVRQNIKKSSKRGLSVRSVQFDDEFIRGVVEIYNETQIKQGRRFWHHGKDFDTVKRETGHELDRSWFIGAYFEDKLVGFIKLLRTREIADIVLIVCQDEYREKKPANALIAKAVELCVEKGMKHLTYAQFYYLKKQNSSLLEFKRRHGFEPILFPRYYVPLTSKGRWVLRMGLHHGVKGALPEWLLDWLRSVRWRFYGTRAAAEQ